MKKIRQVIALLLISTLIIGQLVTDEFAYAINSNSKMINKRTLIIIT